MKNIFYYLILFLLHSCASIDLPPGGDKDILPPVIVESSPRSKEILFTGKTIRIVFDEYFSLNNINSNLLVSPPLRIPPKTKIKGKTLYLYLQEELLPNVTYQFYFGEGIKDLNESNTTKDLRLVFSTGSFIDTNSVTGVALDAFTKEKLEDIKVLLYKEDLDSQLINGQPYYITKSNKNGEFIFNNISDQYFKLYAIDDKNNNNKLDIEESFAVCDTLINYLSKTPTLSLSKQNANETLQIKNLEQTFTSQFKCVFNQQLLRDSLSLKSTEPQAYSKLGDVIWHFGNTSDTVYFYHSNKSITDTTVLLTHKQDTLAINISDIKQSSNSFIPKLSVKKLIPNQPIYVDLNYAVLKTNTTLIRLTDLIDSSLVSIDNIIIEESNKLKITADIQERHEYQIIFAPGSITYIDGSTNLIDTIKQQTYLKDETGEIEISIEFSRNRPYTKTIFLVFEGKTNKLENIPCSSDTVIKKKYIKPDTYTIYAFEDLDDNEQWSPGNYYKKLQPEPIWRVESPIVVRKNWSNKNIQLKLL